MKHANSPKNYLVNLQSKGYSTFTTQDFRRALSLTPTATTFAIHRLKQKGEIATPVHGFHVIIPPEYRSIGSLPPDLMIDQLMTFLKLPYYVGLLSAAEKHGAAHQRPQKYQVIVTKKRKDILCGKVAIKFFQKSKLKGLPIEQKAVKSGYIYISSPELTAFDLVGYQNQSGGLQHVLTVLAELYEKLDNKKLVEVAKLCPIYWAQRLGVLLEMLGKAELIQDLQNYVHKKARIYIPLVLGAKTDISDRNKNWRVFINESLEADEL